MDSKWFPRLIQVAAISLTAAAICQELEKPKADRHWHGRIARFVPYDFRLPTAERLKGAYWNPHDSSIITPEPFGVGWTVNFYALLERLTHLRQDSVTEEDFLMPTQKIKDLLV